MLFQPTPDEFKEEIKKAHEECEKEEGLEGDTAKKIAKGDITDEKVIGAFLLCVSKKMGAIDDKGKVDKKNIAEKMEDIFPDKETLDKAIEKCAVEDDTPEKTATHMAICMTKEVNEHGVTKLKD